MNLNLFVVAGADIIFIIQSLGLCIVAVNAMKAIVGGMSGLMETAGIDIAATLHAVLRIAPTGHPPFLIQFQLFLFFSQLLLLHFMLKRLLCVFV